MTHFLDVPLLLDIAGRLDGDPQCDDLGVLVPTVARHRAELMGRSIYGSDWLKAGAILEELARHPCLEHGNWAIAWACTQFFLAAHGHQLDYKPAAAPALVRDANAHRVSVRQIAAQLRDWAITRTRLCAPPRRGQELNRGPPRVPPRGRDGSSQQSAPRRPDSRGAAVCPATAGAAVSHVALHPPEHQAHDAGPRRVGRAEDGLPDEWPKPVGRLLHSEFSFSQVGLSRRSPHRASGPRKS